MQITNVTCPASKYSIKCPYPMIPEYITVHNTANDASAMAEISYMLGNNMKTSFHAAVDNERVVTGLPFDRNSWNAGDGGNGTGNRKSISIEICYSKSGGDRFDQAERLAAEYIAMLLKQYGWGIDRVRTHQSWSGKYCPHRTLDYGWERFLNIVKEYYDGSEPQPTPTPTPAEGHIYQNGSTSEIIYADTNLTKRIGSLNPRERCYCYGIFNGRPLVRYQVGNTGNYKIGFARWVGGVVNTQNVNITNTFNNGSTRENIYANTNCSINIGSLDPREQCDCLGLFNDRPVVIYRVNGTNNYKTGFAVWVNGIK